MVKLICLSIFLFISSPSIGCEIFVKENEGAPHIAKELQWIQSKVKLQCSRPVYAYYNANMTRSVYAFLHTNKDKHVLEVGSLFMEATVGDRRSILIHELAHVEQVTNPYRKRFPPRCLDVKEEAEAYLAELAFADRTGMSDKMKQDVLQQLENLKPMMQLNCIGFRP